MSRRSDTELRASDQGGRHSPVVLIIPALNEEVAIGTVVRAAPASLVDEVIVVDNGSTDRTAAEARRAGARVVLEPRRGYGAACLAGVRATTPETAIVAFVDGDGSQDPRELERLLVPLFEDRADLVLGIRRPVGHADHPLHAVLGTRAVAQVLRWRFGVALRDLGPFRAIRRETLLALKLREMTYGWPVEMVARAAQAGLRIHEVGVTHRPRLGGKSKVAGTVTGSLRAGWRFVRVALR